MMSAINACIKCISEYEKELGVPKTPLAKAARIELAALEAVAELLQEAVDTHFLEVKFAIRCREALDKVKK